MKNIRFPYKNCTVSNLRRFLEKCDLPDEAPILVPSFDHSYRQPEIRRGKSVW
jgi:hypothetical protein